jgi:hypothetical protein
MITTLAVILALLLMIFVGYKSEHFRAPGRYRGIRGYGGRWRPYRGRYISAYNNGYYNGWPYWIWYDVYPYADDEEQ